MKTGAVAGICLGLGAVLEQERCTMSFACPEGLFPLFGDGCLETSLSDFEQGSARRRSPGRGRTGPTYICSGLIY